MLAQFLEDCKTKLPIIESYIEDDKIPKDINELDNAFRAINSKYKPNSCKLMLTRIFNENVVNEQIFFKNVVPFIFMSASDMFQRISDKLIKTEIALIYTNRVSMAVNSAIFLNMSDVVNFLYVFDSQDIEVFKFLLHYLDGSEANKSDNMTIRANKIFAKQLPPKPMRRVQAFASGDICENTVANVVMHPTYTTEIKLNNNKIAKINNSFYGNGANNEHVLSYGSNSIGSSDIPYSISVLCKLDAIPHAIWFEDATLAIYGVERYTNIAYKYTNASKDPNAPRYIKQCIYNGDYMDNSEVINGNILKQKLIYINRVDNDENFEYNALKYASALLDKYIPCKCTKKEIKYKENTIEKTLNMCVCGADFGVINNVNAPVASVSYIHKQSITNKIILLEQIIGAAYAEYDLLVYTDNKSLANEINNFCDALYINNITTDQLIKTYFSLKYREIETIYADILKELKIAL